jgi:transcriptional regulator with XRE-family HTH domain
VRDCLKELSPRLRLLRERHDLTQEAFAELSGLGFKFYQAIEARRKTNLTLATLQKIANAHGIAVFELLSPEIPTTKPTKKLLRAQNKPARSGKGSTKRTKRL